MSSMTSTSLDNAEYEKLIPLAGYFWKGSIRNFTLIIVDIRWNINKISTVH